MLIIKKFTFDAAHYLPSYNGKCERLHGHTYRLAVKVEGTPDGEGMVIDFGGLKHIVQEAVLRQLDHACLNDLIPVPSAENICLWIWERLAEKLQTERYRLEEVEVWETETSGCVYRGV